RAAVAFRRARLGLPRLLGGGLFVNQLGQFMGSGHQILLGLLQTIEIRGLERVFGFGQGAVHRQPFIAGDFAAVLLQGFFGGVHQTVQLVFGFDFFLVFFVFLRELLSLLDKLLHFVLGELAG